MVLPAKIFEIKEQINFGLIVQKLKNFREEETYEKSDGENVPLVTEILDLTLKENLVSGVFSADFIQNRYYRRQLVEAPITEEASFWVTRFEGRTFLIVVAPSVARGVKKLLSSTVANKLSKILFITSRAIVETKIPHETLKMLHESNPQATRLIWFDQVDLPGVEKLCLAGSDLVDTQSYKDYLAHGLIWYVVFEAQKRGLTMGITRNSVVTLFSKSTKDDLINYIREDHLKLIE
ncbi:MAG: hypothetical protein CW691_01900 [Candidatus Bathyarchaeum sp.]|nr:MAG: hypothetical protein CW691_01900 [Candidatus Bathyarchaeum sp.]